MVHIAAAQVPRNAVSLGSISAGTQLNRMLLLLEPSSAQKTALDTELDALQTPGSCAYHKWLTPQNFAEDFAVSSEDAQQVAAWLTSQGFTVAPLPAGRGWIEFSGTATQVEQSFHSTLNAYTAEDGTHYALTGSISVPKSLAPVIHGLVSLDGIRAAPVITKPEPVQTDISTLAQADSANSAEAITPHILAGMLQLPGTGGAGETIAIPSRSQISTADVNAFRSAFRLPHNPPTETSDSTSTGYTSERASTELAASWAGVAAPNARIVVVPTPNTAATDGIDLALTQIVDRQLAHTVVVNYSTCEAALSEAHRAFYAVLYRQAAAEGISIISAAGDSGAAACRITGSPDGVNTGYAVNALASTPWNTAIGASALTSSASTLTAWSQGASAETAYAGGGGSSAVYQRPAWQTGLEAAQSTRMLPEIALPTGITSTTSRGIAFCYNDSLSAEGCTLMRSGGSGAAAAIFSGISTVFAEKYGAQGNLAPRLYALGKQSGIFDDITEGDARLACSQGATGCDTTGHIGYAATSGYDLATGLGSVNADALIKAWPQATGMEATMIVLTYSPTQTNDTYNPSAKITFTATVASNSGGATPTGTVSFTDSSNGATLAGSPASLTSSGIATLAVSSGLSIGGNNIAASYSGDSTYAANSSQPVVITLQPSTTTLTVTPSSLMPAASASMTVSVALTVGSPVAGSASPTGLVTLNVDGKATGASSLATSGGKTTASFTITAPATTGSHTLQAVYAGDENYSASTSNPVTLTISKAAVTITLTASPTTLTIGIPEAFTAVLAPASGSTGNDNITGTVSFYDGSTLLGSAAVSSYAATLSSVTLDTSKSHLITAVYSGDSNWAPVTSAPLSLAFALLADTVTLTATPTAAGPGQAVTFTITVAPTKPPAATYEQNPSGVVTFYNGTQSIGAATLAASSGNTSTATFTTSALPAGSDTITAIYAGDSYYAVGTSNAITITVEDFALGQSPSGNLTVIKGQSGQASFIVSGLGGYNNQIQITCTPPPQDDMTCSPSPTQVTPTATVTFTVQTYAKGGPSSSSAHRGDGPGIFARAASGTAIAFVLVLAPIGRRARLLRRTLALILFLTALCGAGMGCGSPMSTGSNGTGTPLGTATIPIVATAYVNQTVINHTIYLTVNVIPPS